MLTAAKFLRALPIPFLLFVYIHTPVIGADDSSMQSAKCQNSFSAGYLFDNYERFEYVNQLLVMHFKLKKPYNDGRVWYSSMYLFKPDCTYEEIKIEPGFKVRPALQFFSIRFNSPTHFDLWDDEQDIRISCNTCSFNLPAELYGGIKYAAVGYRAYIDGGASSLASMSRSITEKPVEIKDPVLIIPGLLGTEISYYNQKIWPNLEKMLVDSGNFMAALEMNESGFSRDAYLGPGQVLKNINYKFGIYHYTDLLVEEFTRNGYKENRDLFMFAYDWRFSPAVLNIALKNKIQEIFRLTGAKKINLVGHSFGGLVLKHYLVNIAFSAEEEDKIGKVIFVGVPHLGTAEAAKALIFGTNLGIPLLNADKMQVIVQNMPSIYHMLPSKEYFKNLSGFYDDLTDPNVKKILDYDQSRKLLLDLGKNEQLLKDADTFHDLDNNDFKTKKYPVYNIVGCGTFTIKTINKMYKGAQNLLKRLFKGPKYRIYADSGDGVVLMPSAASLNLPTNRTFFFRDVEHGKMLSAAGIRQLLVALANGESSSPAQTASDKNNCYVQGRLVSFKSDVDFEIKDTATGKTIDRNTFVSENKIGEDLHIFLPARFAKYQVIFKNKSETDARNYDVSITKIEQNNTAIFNYNFNSRNTFNFNTGGGHEKIEEVDGSGKAKVVEPEYLYEQTKQSEDNSREPVRTVLKNSKEEAPMNGVIELDENSARIFLSFDNKDNLLGFNYSFDSGNTWASIGSDKNFIDIPHGTDSIMYLSESVSGILEDQKTVRFRWSRKTEPPKPSQDQDTQKSGQDQYSQKPAQDPGGQKPKEDKPADTRGDGRGNDFVQKPENDPGRKEKNDNAGSNNDSVRKPENENNIKNGNGADTTGADATEEDSGFSEDLETDGPLEQVERKDNGSHNPQELPRGSAQESARESMRGSPQGFLGEPPRELPREASKELYDPAASDSGKAAEKDSKPAPVQTEAKLRISPGYNFENNFFAAPDSRNGHFPVNLTVRIPEPKIVYLNPRDSKSESAVNNTIIIQDSLFSFWRLVHKFFIFLFSIII